MLGLAARGVLSLADLRGHRAARVPRLRGRALAPTALGGPAAVRVAAPGAADRTIRDPAAAHRTTRGTTRAAHRTVHDPAAAHRTTDGTVHDPGAVHRATRAAHRTIRDPAAAHRTVRDPAVAHRTTRGITPVAGRRVARVLLPRQPSQRPHQPVAACRVHVLAHHRVAQPVQLRLQPLRPLRVQ
ncbi:hypothetical protein [Streptomyces sp. MAR4 CNX-425]|uniref:hypothetical protein n=1 Tax=Streptomyces sp. MAR4 CNX-425 TaxID=3406343 RepID=UPI003B512D40